MYICLITYPCLKLPWFHGDSSIFRRVIIPNGFYSVRFLFWRVIIPRFLILKDHYSKDFYPETIIIPKIFIPKGYHSEDFYLQES